MARKKLTEEEKIISKNNRKEYDKEYRLKNKEKQKELSKNNKEKRLEYLKKYREDNKEYFSNYQKEWLNKNPNYKNNYDRNRKEIDPEFKLKTDISALIRISINRNGYKKNSRTYEILNCTYIEFKEYIENQFEEWMNWNNHGNSNNYNINWEYDHIIPISIAKNKEQIIILNNYLNFRPFCSLSNLQKNNKIDYKLINTNRNLVNYLIKNKEQLEDILDFNQLINL